MSRSTRRLRVVIAVGLLSFLPAFTNIKAGGFQAEDLVLVLILCACTAKFILRGFRFSIVEQLLQISRLYLVLFLVLLVFALAAYRLPVYPLDEASVLKTPLLSSASHFIQFAAVVCGFLWLGNALVSDIDRLHQALTVYWRTGTLSCVFAVVSYVLLEAVHVDLLGAYEREGVIRARGFFIEGGPFGIYLISVLIIGMVRRTLTGKRLGRINTFFVLTAFLLSRSRAAFFLVGVLLLLRVMTASSIKKRITYLILATAATAGLMVLMNVQSAVEGYIDAYNNIENTLATVGRFDPNLVLGRVAGAYIVPRMIKAHPLTGIGFGNYSLMRNDPRYLGSLPDVRWAEDLPGLGLFGDAAELGIPATLLFVFLLLAPYRTCRHKGSILGTAAVFQLLAYIWGVHINFFYPWFVSACAIAAQKYSASPAHDHILVTIRPGRAPLLAATTNAVIEGTQ